MIIKLHTRVVFRNIFSLNMNVTNILVIIVIIKLQTRVFYIHTFSLKMTVANNLVIIVVYRNINI